jgi:hypothetical protein
VIGKNLIPKFNASSATKQLSGLTGQGVQQSVTDYSKAATSKLQGELASKLSSSKMAANFSKLSSGIDLVKANKKIIASVSGTGQFIGDVEDLPENNVPAETLAAGASGGATDQFKVTLTASPALGDGNDVIVFDVMPTVSEQHSASYDTVDIVHHPGGILKYKGTNARSWDITADLVSRTVQEADKNLKYMNIIRSWVMPFYGQGTADNPTTADKLGAPPQVLTLSAYGPKMIGPVTCVLDSFSWIFENEMDYIRTSDGTPFPVHVKVSMNLKETWAPSQFTSFDLMSYRSGDMGAAFAGPASGATTPPAISTVPASALDPSNFPAVDSSLAGFQSQGFNQAISGSGLRNIPGSSFDPSSLGPFGGG